MKYSLQMRLALVISLFFSGLSLTFIGGLVIPSSAEAQTQTPALRKLPADHLKLYNLLGVPALFVSGNGRAPLADSLRDAVSAADNHGMTRAGFWNKQTEDLFQSVAIGDPLAPPPITDATGAPGSRQLAQSLEKFEQAMMNVLFNYAKALSIGQVKPKDVGSDIRLEQKLFSVEALADAVKNISLPLADSLDALAPKWPLYAQLQQALMRMKIAEATGAFPTLEIPAKSFKVGESAENIRALKVRLQTLGYAVPDVDAVYRENLTPVVKQYLIDHGLDGTGVLDRGSAVWKHLGVNALTRGRQIRLQMEKLRWLPQYPEAKHIFVNLAFQHMAVWENGTKTIEMKTINGRPARATPMLKDKLTIVELNPSWTVPPRIVVFDKIDAIRADPGYLRKNNFILLDKDFREIKGWRGGWNEIDLNQIDSYYLRQQPGTGNALGITKFHLSNPYAIYLHDTNERDLFSKRNRQLSSGCIRLERPVDFAAFLLESHATYGDRRVMESKLATTRLASKDIPWMEKVNLPKSIPTYTVFMTVDVTAQGQLLFANDSYTQDQRLTELLTLGYVSTKSPADIENAELERREKELREGGSNDDEDWGWGSDWRKRQREEERRLREEERRREREERERRRGRGRGYDNECTGFWC